MWAILSDIHANLEALQAVAADIERQNVERVICLGNLIGFGPNPCECVDWAMGCDVCIQGDFDEKIFRESALEDTDSFNSAAHSVTKWTLQQLSQGERWLKFLDTLPLTYCDQGFQFGHGSPRNPLRDYVFPEDVHNSQKLRKLFDLVKKYCFKGHTHVPGVFTEDLKYLSPMEVNYVYQLDGRKTLIDVGSVGQPRDGDPRACYVLLDDGVVTFRRIDYDVEKTRGKIWDNPNFDRYLGDRLTQGN
ncbi:metallophosphatase family protein [bacterium]|nr:metallophosphatase family protein [bacterium]